jgi:hypothetical protein
MDAQRAVQEKQHQLSDADMAFRISLEGKKKDLVALKAPATNDARSPETSGRNAARRASGLC